MSEVAGSGFLAGNRDATSSGQTCVRCLYDDSIPGAVFEGDKQCSYCVLFDEMDAQYPTGEAGELALGQVVEEMKAAGSGGAAGRAAGGRHRDGPFPGIVNFLPFDY